MPVSLSQIAANTATAEMEFEGGGTLNIVYYPLKITDEMLLQGQRFTAAGNDEAAVTGLMHDINTQLVDIVQSWDLLEDDGVTPIPLTVERLQRLSPVIKAMAIQAIIGSISPEAMAPKIKQNGAI